jgi:transcriptional regulator with XRE-family HTH domain
MSLGHVLKLIRAHRELNQKQMAELLGISQNYLSLIESGKKKPSADRISEMAKNLKISSDALVFIASDVPEELSSKDRKDFNRLQMNIISLLLFELTGDMTEIV